MTELLAALSAIATALAWVLTKRRRDHLPFAVFLTVSLVADLARLALQSTILPSPTLDGPPLEGLARVAGHCESALYMTWHFGMLALAQRVYGRRPIWPVAGAYALTWIALVLLYPITRQAILGQIYTGIAIAAVVLSLATFARWARKERPNITQASTLVLLASEAAALLGPYRLGIFDHWFTLYGAYLVLYVSLIGIQGIGVLASGASRKGDR